MKVKFTLGARIYFPRNDRRNGRGKAIIKYEL